MVESLPTARILLLVNYRPEYQHGWANKTYYRQLQIDPLPPESAEELLDALLGDDASLSPLKQLLIDQTEGNPFFMEESVRTLMETKVLVGERGNYRLEKKVESTQVPATVQAVLAARIDRLPPEEKQLLQSAAVIGKDVPFPLLQAIAELSDEELRHSLVHLQAAEFLYETSLFPDLEYTFKHTLTHEVAYGSLLQERRRTLHAGIVEALEKLYPDRLVEHVERLAHHALRGEVWDKAVDYFRQAGAKAAGRMAYREAVACFEQALVALDHLPKTRETLENAVDIRFDLRDSLNALGEQGRVLDYLCEAKTLAESVSDQRRLGRVLSYISQNFWLMGDADGAIESGQNALNIAEALGDFPLQVATNLYLGRAYHALGHYYRAIDFFRRNVALLEGDLARERFGVAGFPSVLSRTWLVWCLAELGEFAEGIVRGEEGVRIAEGGDHPFSLIGAYLGVGRIYLRKGNLDRAFSTLERGLELCRVWNIPVWVPFIASHLGYVYAHSGRIADAISLLEQAASSKRKADLSLWTAWLSETYLLTGCLEDASNLAEQALALAWKHKERGNEAWALRLLGEIHSHQDPPDVEKAEEHCLQAMALAEELGMRPLLAHCHLGLGKLFRRAGKQQQAKEHLTTATAMMRDMEMGLWLEKAEAELKELG